LVPPVKTTGPQSGKPKHNILWVGWVVCWVGGVFVGGGGGSFFFGWRGKGTNTKIFQNGGPLPHTVSSNVNFKGVDYYYNVSGKVGDMHRCPGRRLTQQCPTLWMGLECLVFFYPPPPLFWRVLVCGQLRVRASGGTWQALAQNTSGESICSALVSGGVVVPWGK